MKKGIDILGAESVLDEFHIRKYIRKMIRLGGGATEEDRKKAEETLLEWIEKGNRKSWRNGLPGQAQRLWKKKERNLRKAGNT